MSGMPTLPGASDARLALPLLPGAGERPRGSRRAALGLALLALAAPAALVATGRVHLPRGRHAATAPGRKAPPRAVATEAALARPPPPPRAEPPAPEARPASDRVVAPTYAAALLAQHSWYVPPPPPPAAPPPPPPEPTAPPLPYTLVGSYAPDGVPPVYFLAHGDRVIDARIGDRLEGVYQLESAAGGQLVFVYLPLNIRQNLAATGASR